MTQETTAAYGLEHFFTQSDAVTHGVALALLVMSTLSWTQIVLKTGRLWQMRRNKQGVARFWQATTFDVALQQLPKHSIYQHLAQQSHAAVQHFDAQQHQSIGMHTDRSDFLTRALRQSIATSTARLESGLTLLASIGAISPFIGLFGTVWGIYHALLTIAATGSASIDKVSGPVGEALIMTAAGLFVAIPAVLAYNAFTRINRVEMAHLDGFAHDLHAYFATGARVEPSKGGV